MPELLIESLRQTAPERVSVVLSDGEEIASTLAVVSDLRLFRGQALDGAALEELRNASALALLKGKALEILSRRPLSAKELNDKLLQKGADAKSAASAGSSTRISWTTRATPPRWRGTMPRRATAPAASGRSFHDAASTASSGTRRCKSVRTTAKKSTN